MEKYWQFSLGDVCSFSFLDNLIVFELLLYRFFCGYDDHLLWH